MTTIISNNESQASLCLNLETKNFTNCPISFESGNIVKGNINYWYVRGTCAKCGIEEYTEDTYTNSPLPYNTLHEHLTELQNLLA